ncbi:MAG: DUF3734 domain-containing protein, partial [Hyphomicrobiaceae bacterium]
MAKLPDELKDDADTKSLAKLCDDREWTIARLTNQRLPHVSSTKDYEFSQATVREHWAAGLEDVRLSVANRKELKPSELGPGVKIYNLPGTS